MQEKRKLNNINLDIFGPLLIHKKSGWATDPKTLLFSTIFVDNLEALKGVKHYISWGFPYICRIAKIEWDHAFGKRKYLLFFLGAQWYWEDKINF